jgi:hypothetical protein
MSFFLTEQRHSVGLETFRSWIPGILAQLWLSPVLLPFAFMAPSLCVTLFYFTPDVLFAMLWRKV